MKEKRPMDCRRALKLVHGLFYSGLAVMILMLMIVNSGVGKPGGLTVVGAVLGLLACIGSLVLGFGWVRCPHCGGSLMAGGRIPSRLPAYCSHCGAPLTENKESE